MFLISGGAIDTFDEAESRFRQGATMTQQIVMRKLEELRPHAGNARTHSRKQIVQIARSIERFGFTNPILVADDGEIRRSWACGSGPSARLDQGADTCAK
jgi:hypothetical protein